LATVRLRLQEATPGTTISFNRNRPRQTGVVFFGGALTLDGAENALVINNAPTPISPADQTITSDRTPTFSWQALPNAVRYEIQLGLNNPPTQIIETTATTYTPSDLLMTTYHWRVRTIDSNGTRSAWSETRTLNITSSSSAVPSRNLSINGAPQLSWGRITWATQFYIEVRRGSTTGTVVFSQYVPADTLLLTPPGLTRGVYYWRVRAIRSNGRAGGWSAFDSFTVEGS
jgi:hypothetical protein